jgi:DNA mismatch repair endonuclease MutH
MKHPKPDVDYDQASIESILCHAMKLEGSSLREQLEIPPEMKYDRKDKGSFGKSVEHYYFGLEPNSRNEPDFPVAGLELKVTPLKMKKQGELVPKERLIITMIDYPAVVKETFESGRLYHKINNILLMHYLHEDGVAPFDLEFKVIHVWEPPAEDYPTIKDDWEKIVGKVNSGSAHELSGADTNYLEACPKSSNSRKTRKQPFSDIPAKPRAFALKASYMRTVLKTAMNAQAIAREKGQESLGIEQLVSERIAPYIGMSDKDLCAKFNRDYNLSNKNLWVTLTYRMLGITSNRSSEFIKANITVRTVREENDGKIKESMSLTPFDFSSLVREDWSDSELFNYLDETRFLFVVFKSDGNDYRLKGAAFWNMPTTLLDTVVRPGWEAIRNTILSGVSFTEKIDKNGTSSFENNLPKKRDNAAIHIRPHAVKSAYRFSDGREVGNVGKDASKLPDGQWMTRQSFWLNNDFIATRLSELGL